MKTKITNALKEMNPDSIVLVTVDRFAVIYSDILVEKYHGEFNSNAIFIYGTSVLNEIIESELSKFFPNHSIFAM